MVSGLSSFSLVSPRAISRYQATQRLAEVAPTTPRLLCFGAADETPKRLSSRLIEATRIKASIDNAARKGEVARAGFNPLSQLLQSKAWKSLSLDKKVLTLARALENIGFQDPRRFFRSEPTSQYLKHTPFQYGKMWFWRTPLSGAEGRALGFLAHTLERALLQEADPDCLLDLNAFGLGKDWANNLENPRKTVDTLWWLLVQNHRYTAPNALKSKIANL